MKLIIENACNQKFLKEKKEVQKEILSAAKRLGDRIIEYAQAGKRFECIFNDDHVKYDKHGDFYTYKHHGKNKTQLRLLYVCKQTDESTTIIISDYFIKRTSNSKEHIKKFNMFDTIDFVDFLNGMNVVQIA